MKCFLVSDVHCRPGRYPRLFRAVEEERPDAVFLAGDLLPDFAASHGDPWEIMEENLFLPAQKVREGSGGATRFFAIMGNDDPRAFEEMFLEWDKKGVVDYVHGKTVPFGDMFVAGYAMVPPTPFLLKDWERYDVSAFVDVGSISPEEGHRTVPVDPLDIRYRTITKDLDELAKLSDPGSTIYLFHSPPYQTALDRADLDGVQVDSAPLDVHVGSIAIKRFIEKRQPPITLHGHVHESFRMTGAFVERTGHTFSFGAGHEGPELALVRFDTEAPEKSTQELLAVD